MATITSANTSINSAKLPATFSKIHFEPHTTNLDYGGGKFDNASEFLHNQGISNLVYDPYNRTQAHNEAVVARLREIGGADSVTCNNVLNVIQDDNDMRTAIRNCARWMKGAAPAYFKIYEGDKSGHGRITKPDCYQRNWPAAMYEPYLKECFRNVTRYGTLWFCTDPTV